MNLETYYGEALRTHVPRGLTFDLNHSVIGLVTEIGEVATVIKRNEIYGKPWDDEMRGHLAEELGDICWYIPCGLQALGHENPAQVFDWLMYDQIIPLSQLDCVKAMAYAAGRLAKSCDTLKYKQGRIILQRAALTDDYGAILGAVHRLCEIHMLDFSAILEGNIAKLRKRYPEKFTAELAEARLDKGGASSRES